MCQTIVAHYIWGVLKYQLSSVERRAVQLPMSQHLVHHRLPLELGHQLASYLVRIREECDRMDQRHTYSRLYAADLASFYVRIFS